MMVMNSWVRLQGRMVEETLVSYLLYIQIQHQMASIANQAVFCSSLFFPLLHFRPPGVASQHMV
jgi:hypothetical protein